MVQQSGLDLTHQPKRAHIATLACQRAPYLATLLTAIPTRIGPAAGDAYCTAKTPASS
jgi:hypothetical protein